MQLQIGDKAPNFVAYTTQGLINFHDWMEDSWAMFFSHPGDFTPVCTTELGRTAQLELELSLRNVKALGLSTDSVDEHLAWIDDINESQHTDFFVPMITDPDGVLADLYGMINYSENRTTASRQLYIVDESKRIRFAVAYPASVGRNFCEILRVIDALRLTDRSPLVTPADWQPGEPAVISPALDDQDAAIVFKQGWNEVLPYLRYVDTDITCQPCQKKVAITDPEAIS